MEKIQLIGILFFAIGVIGILHTKPEKMVWKLTLIASYLVGMGMMFIPLWL